jgi:DNA-binding LytR/AlgR family response regulator
MHSQQQVKSDDQKINIKDGYKTQMVNLDDILYLKADNIHVEYHTKQRVVLSCQSLIKSIENLPSDRFIRIHKSYAINKSFITSYGAKFVRLGPISYSYKDSFRAAISS